MIRALKRHWFLLVLALLLGLGFGWPQELAGSAERAPRESIVAGVLFLMALPLELRSLWQTIRRPGPALLAIAINAVLVPLLAWLAGRLLATELATGPVIAAAIPCTLASAAVWTRRAGGNDALAIPVMIVTNLACFAVTPFWLRWLTQTDVASGGVLDAGPMIQRLVLLVVLPIVAAQLLRLWRPLGRWAAGHKVALSLIAQFGVLAMIGLGAVAAGLRMGDAETGQGLGWGDWLGMLAAVLGVHLAALGLGHCLARACGMTRPDRIAIGFAGSQKILMVGLDLGLEYFTGLTILPIVAYHVCQLLADTLIAERLRDGRDDQA